MTKKRSESLKRSWELVDERLKRYEGRAYNSLTEEEQEDVKDIVAFAVSLSVKEQLNSMLMPRTKDLLLGDLKKVKKERGYLTDAEYMLRWYLKEGVPYPGFRTPKCRDERPYSPWTKPSYKMWTD